MKTYFENYKHFGKCLFIENSEIKIGVPVEFGIRISYLSYKGSDNLFFEQPKDMTDLTSKDGWRVYGGHRLWVAPESDNVYYPDNNPISYEIFDDKVVLHQQKDEWLNVEKTMEISFTEYNVVKVVNLVKNLDEKTRRFSAWGITSVAGGGTQFIPLKHGERSYYPLSNVCAWHYTNLGDERVEYFPEYIKLSHRATNKLFKIGVGHPNGPVKYVNKGVCFEKSFDIYSDKEYTDSNVSYETYMCNHMVEIESLSPLYEVNQNQTISHTELWRLTKN